MLQLKVLQLLSLFAIALPVISLSLHRCPENAIYKAEMKGKAADVKKYLQLGCDPNEKPIDADSALCLAVSDQDDKVVNALLNTASATEGVRVIAPRVNELCNHIFLNPLAVAAKLGRVDFVKKLLSAGSDVDFFLPVDLFKSAFGYALLNKDEAVLDEIYPQLTDRAIRIASTTARGTGTTKWFNAYLAKKNYFKENDLMQ